MNEVIVLILSSFKFAMTFPIAIMEFGFGFFKTILWTNLGGFSGILFFTFLSETLIRFWRKTVYPLLFKNRRQKKERSLIRFSSRIRRIVKIKQTYGLPGLAFLTPLLLSIPVGTFIGVRYFRNKKILIAWLTLSNFIWSFIYTGFYELCYDFYKQWL
jgi:hypothetical protein